MIELLTVVAIIGVLSSLVFAVTTKVRQHAAVVNESAVARNLITAFLAYPQDNGGAFARGRGSEPHLARVRGFNNDVITDGIVANRWTWKLANVMADDQGASGLYIKDHMDFYNEIQSYANRDYMVSVTPSLGLNASLVGGNYESTTVAPDSVVATGDRRNRKYESKFPHDYCVTRPEIAYKPGQLIVFISSYNRDVGSTYGYEEVGYYYVKAPHAPNGNSWAASYSEKYPENTGNVSLRHDGKAVAAMLDGSVQMMDEAELRDMRHWSNQAIRYDDPNYSNFTRD